MYPVSEAFLQVVQENIRHYYWTGRITTAAGMVYLLAVLFMGSAFGAVIGAIFGKIITSNQALTKWG